MACRSLLCKYKIVNIGLTCVSTEEHIYFTMMCVGAQAGYLSCPYFKLT